ncbi:MAG: chlororespiratory reduction protein 7 [Thermostichus sp. DG02_5_bins_236]
MSVYRSDYEPEQLRAASHYVLLMPGLPEQFLSSEELQEFLEQLLQEHPHLVDADLARYPTLQAQAQRLIDTACEVEVTPGETLQWHPVRLNKRASNPLRFGSP